DKVVLKGGSAATLSYAAPEMGVAVVRRPNGKTETVPLEEIRADRPNGVAVEFVLADSPHPQHKASPSLEQISKSNESAPQKSVKRRGPSWDFQRRTCGPTEFLFKGGGEQVWADGPITPEGLVLEAKYVEKPRRSPFIYSSSMRYDIRR